MTSDQPTIAALLTPLAPGAIAVIGIAGPRTDSILATVLRRPHGDAPPVLGDRHPTVCRLMDGIEVVDDVLAVRIRRRDTTVAEIHAHGGVRVAQRALMILERCGAGIVDGLEFHERHAEDDPVRRDVDRALLQASSRRLTRWLLAQRGLLPSYLARFAGLDAAERDAFKKRSEAATRLLQGLSVAIIGPANAGKSTLANRLIGAERVITSDQPGTTRDWVAETALIKGWPVTLTDTAGIRETNCPIEAEAVRRGSTQAQAANLVLVVLDATMEGDNLRRQYADLVGMVSLNRLRIVVLNKSDLFAGSVPPATAARISPADVSEPVSVSALTGAGIDVLESLIERLLGLDQLDDSLPTGFLPAHLVGI